MNRPSKITAAHSSHLSSNTGAAGGCSPVPSVAPTLLTAPADKVSPRGFLDALGLSSPEMREARREQTRQRCRMAIARGDTYGFPPSLVSELKKDLGI